MSRRLGPWLVSGLHLGGAAAGIVVVVGSLVAVAERAQVSIESTTDTRKAATQTKKILAEAEALSREVADLLRKMGVEASKKQSASVWADPKPERSDNTLSTLSPSPEPAELPERRKSSQLSTPVPSDSVTGRTGTLAQSPEVAVPPEKPSPSRETTQRTETQTRTSEAAVAPVQPTQPPELASSLQDAVDATAGIAEPRAQTGKEAQDGSLEEAETEARQKPADRGDVVADAWALIQQGDIKGGRLALEQAVAHGNARAAFLLAATYDPNRHRAWRRNPKLRSALEKAELSPDPTKAREFYARAAASGHAQARARAEALK